MRYHVEMVWLYRGSHVFIQHAVEKKNRLLLCDGIKLLNNCVVLQVTGLQVHSTNCIPTLTLSVEDVINYL